MGRFASLEKVFQAAESILQKNEADAVENQLHQAAKNYQRALEMAGEYPQSVVANTCLGMARVCYEWNDLDAAQRHGEQGVQLARQKEMNDQAISHEAFLARLKLAQGDVAEASAIVDRANQSICQHNFIHRIPEVVAVQVRVLLRQGNLATALNLAQKHDLPRSQARVCLAQGDTSTALTILNFFRERMETRDRKDEILKILVLQAVALHAHGETNQAVERLGEALSLAEPGGFVKEGCVWPNRVCP
ncbi:MAG: tetratricopeptide repeat protein [Chloroflexi bacterium]|nr:tetratricopeptide repeat protein [Chloroflexota bacterium]